MNNVLFKRNNKKLTYRSLLLYIKDSKTEVKDPSSRDFKGEAARSSDHFDNCPTWSLFLAVSSDGFLLWFQILINLSPIIISAHCHLEGFFPGIVTQPGEGTVT